MFELTIGHILLIAVATWHYALWCGFVSDDHAVIAQRKDIIPDGEKQDRQEKFWVKVFNDGPVMYFVNRFMWRFFNKQPFWWHLLSLSMHIFNTYLFYLVAVSIIGREAALIAALIWTVNPMHNQIVVWCSGRPYAFAVCLSLICLLFWDNPLIVIPLYTLATITSFMTAFLPIIIKLIHPEAWQGNLYLGILFAMIPIFLWKFTRRFGRGALILDRANFQFRFKRLNNLARVYMYYILALIFPVKMGWYHESGFRYNDRWDGFNVWAVIGFVAVFYLTQQAYGVWFLLGMIPQMNLLASNSYLQDRYLYFGSMGLALLAAPYLIEYPFILVAFVAICVSKSYTYTRQMTTDEALYRENWRNHKASDYAINNLAFFLIQQQRFEEARIYIKRGLAINRDNKLLWYNLGITWAAQAHLKSQEGKFRFFRALDCWKMALQLEPRWRKPAEDIEKLTKYLLEAKVLTTNPADAAAGLPVINMPMQKGK